MCELHNEKVGEDVIAASIAHETEFQPAMERSRLKTTTEETAGKKICNIMKYFE
eukprot:gene17237-18957_t